MEEEWLRTRTLEVKHVAPLVLLLIGSLHHSSSLCLSLLIWRGCMSQIWERHLVKQLRHPHPIPRCLGLSPIIVLDSQLPTKAHAGKQVMAKYLSFSHPHRKCRLNSLPPALAWPSPGWCNHLGTEPVDERFLPVHLPLR